MNKLTNKQRKFCLEYLKDFNATRAAKDSGYSIKTAGAIGTENLSKPIIQEHLTAVTTKAEQKAEIDIALILKHLYDMAFFDPVTLLDERGDLLPVSEWPPGAGTLIQGLEIESRITTDGSFVTVKKIKIPSRERNTENLGRYLAMFTDKIKDISDPTEVVHYYVPKFREESDPVIPGDDDGGNGRFQNNP